MSDDRFKQCQACKEWFTLTDILENPELEPTGLSFEKGSPEANLFYFVHTATHCGSSFVVPVRDLMSLIDEPIPANILGDTEICEAHCTQLEDWVACGQDCFYSPFRRLLLDMVKRKGLAIPTA